VWKSVLPDWYGRCDIAILNDPPLMLPLATSIAGPVIHPVTTPAAEHSYHTEPEVPAPGMAIPNGPKQTTAADLGSSVQSPKEPDRRESQHHGKDSWAWGGRYQGGGPRHNGEKDRGAKGSNAQFADHVENDAYGDRFEGLGLDKLVVFTGSSSILGPSTIMIMISVLVAFC